MSEHVVALLRGMNTGGNRFPMADLRAALADAGFVEPRTLLASGNVVVRAPAEAEAIERVILDTFGLAMPVITRTGAELAAVAAGSPLAVALAKPPLGPATTVRNLNTVAKLVTMAS